MKLYISLLLTSLMFFSCVNDSSKTKGDMAYFGGEIINPSSRYIVLEKRDVKVDTIRLDGNNRFLFKVDSLKEGLYTFKHGGEYQLVLLEPNDSVLLRLNTIEFDESLVYTGKGSKKNNYFINEFLQNEEEEEHVLKLCQLKPKAYEKHIDSIKAKKVKHLEHFKKKYDVSDLFLKIAQANIDYCYYSSKEVYPFAHYKKNKGSILKSMPDDFYSYRKNLNYNNAFFRETPSYYKFLKRHLSNLSLEMQYKIVEDEEPDAFKHGMLSYNLDRLFLIDSLITDKTIKDELLYHFTIKYLSLNNGEEENNVVLKSFLDKTSNEASKTSIANYVSALKKLAPGSNLPSLQILDYSNNEFEINSIINKPTVITFWSNALYTHFKDSHLKIKELKDKYPEVKFVTINIDGYSPEKTRVTLKTCKFNCKDEYLFKNPEKSKKVLAIYPMTKAIIVDEDKKIVNANSNMFSWNFEQQILGLLNR